jgi:hypothetical protein
MVTDSRPGEEIDACDTGAGRTGCDVLGGYDGALGYDCGPDG